MGDMESGFDLSAMVDDVKASVSNAKEKGMKPGIIRGLDSVAEGMIDLGSIVKTPAHEKRVKADIEKLIAELKDCCEKGDQGLTTGKMRTLRDRVNVLKVILARG